MGTKRAHLTPSKLDAAGEESFTERCPAIRILIRDIRLVVGENYCSVKDKMTSKNLVIAVAGALVACTIITIGNRILTFGGDPKPNEAVRLSLTVVLSILLIRGWRPSRIISIVLLSVSVIVGLAFTIYFLANEFFPSFVILLCLVHGGCLYALLTPTAKRHFAQKLGTEQDEALKP